MNIVININNIPEEFKKILSDVIQVSKGTAHASIATTMMNDEPVVIDFGMLPRKASSQMATIITELGILSSMLKPLDI